MRIKIQQFLTGANHSWGVVGLELARAWKNLGHELDLISTNGHKEKYTPNDLKEFFKSEPSGIYNLQLSYTLPHNLPKYLINGNKNRFAIWTYEFPIIPPYLAKYHTFADYILPPSEFVRQQFLMAGVPEAKLKLVEHGIDLEAFKNKNKFQLKTKKNKKLFLNVGQPHLRKNIAGTIEAYYKAFHRDDDICLVAKISKPPPEAKNHPNYINSQQIIEKLNKQYKNHSEIELITEYIPNIIDLYNTCDIVLSLTHSEGFYLPGLEGMAAGKMIIAPRHGGQLQYLNDQNSILIDGQLERAPAIAQYWEPNNQNTWFKSDLDDASIKLQLSIKNYDTILKSHQEHYQPGLADRSWNSIAHQILALVV